MLGCVALLEGMMRMLHKVYASHCLHGSETWPVLREVPGPSAESVPVPTHGLQSNQDMFMSTRLVFVDHLS